MNLKIRIFAPALIISMFLTLGLMALGELVPQTAKLGYGFISGLVIANIYGFLNNIPAARE